MNRDRDLATTTQLRSRGRGSRRSYSMKPAFAAIGPIGHDRHAVRQLPVGAAQAATATSQPRRNRARAVAARAAPTA
ncbi:hypothetical protein LC55x_5680 [Lysobacter capsici]|nr:hypothetical protein LC55x_5680 [Lysobacter capsici]